MSTFADLVKEANSSEMKKSDGGFFKFVDGNNNVFRVLTSPEIMYEDFDNGIVFKGCGFQGTPVALAYVLDRADNTIKLAKLKWGLIKDLATWEGSGDFNITGEYPMRYDIRANKTGTSKQTKYTYNIVPKESEVPADWLAKEMENKKTCRELIEKWQEKAKAGHIEEDEDDAPLEIPAMPDPFPTIQA